MSDLPIYIPITFVASTIFSIITLLYSLRPKVSNRVLVFVGTGISLILAVQAILALNKFYLVFDAVPPRFPFGFVPSTIILALVFVFTSRKVIMQLPLDRLTLIHIVRIPVELGLWWLYHAGQLPKLMTFEGSNIDILAGITAIFVYWFAFIRSNETQPNVRFLLIWNFGMLLLLFNIITRAALSVPNVTQLFGLDQPNIAINYFPYIWLPAVIVPIVLFSHFASIAQLIQKLRKLQAAKGKLRP